MSAPLCINGHGVMERRSVEQRVYDDGSSKMMANWTCGQCGHRLTRPATEIDEAAQVCDFCSSPQPVKAYPCEDFGYVIVGFDASTTPNLVMSRPSYSRGEWLACAECVKFIDANDQPGLTSRSEHVLLLNSRWNDEQRRVIRSSLEQMHREFFSHRIIEHKEVSHGTTGD